MFERIAECCKRLFDGSGVRINLVGEDGMIHVRLLRRSESGTISPCASRSTECRNRRPGRAVLERRIVHYPDIEHGDDVPEYAPLPRGDRTEVALCSHRCCGEGRGIGAIVGRERIARAFSEKEIALLKTFADQAVIAIQNARLFNETKEALEQQTAIAEILRVISSSPTDMQPVLEAIADRAARLCDASSASMYLTEGDDVAASRIAGPSPDPVSHVESLPIDRQSISGRALLDGETVQVADMLAERRPIRAATALAQRFGHRTVIVMPLYREGQSVGTILLRRDDVRPSTSAEVALLRTFG